MREILFKKHTRIAYFLIFVFFRYLLAILKNDIIVFFISQEKQFKREVKKLEWTKLFVANAFLKKHRKEENL